MIFLKSKFAIIKAFFKSIDIIFITNKYNIKADISKLLNRKFKLGKKKYGGQAQSTSITRLIEDSCNTKLRAKNFPKILTDNEEKKQGVEIKF